MSKTAPKEGPTAIEKALEIVVAFADANRELGTGDISELTGFHKATTSRILATLLKYGLVSHDRTSKKYRLGPLAYRLGLSLTSQTTQSFVDELKPHIDQLRDKLNETISLELWTGDRTVACYLAESRNPLRVPMLPAKILPLYAPAGSKAILSFLSLDYLDGLLSDNFEALTKNTISSKAELMLRLKEYNRQGYAVDNEELHDGVYAIGVPIFDSLSRPIAAVSAIMPANRVSHGSNGTVVTALKHNAKVVTQQFKESNPYRR